MTTKNITSEIANWTFFAVFSPEICYLRKVGFFLKKMALLGERSDCKVNYRTNNMNLRIKTKPSTAGADALHHGICTHIAGP